MESLELLVLRGETGKVKRRLRKKTYADEELSAALISAALTGNHRLMCPLIEAGANKKAMNRALLVAALEGETSFSLGNGTDLEENILSALKQASYRHRIKSVEVLLGHGIDISLIPLTEFFKFEQFEMNAQLPEKNDLLRLFIRAGMDVNADKGKTLSKAVIYGYDDFVRILLDAGATLDNAYGQSSLVYAAERGGIELVEMLVRKGASLEDEDLLYSVYLKGQTEMLNYLIEQGTELRPGSE